MDKKLMQAVETLGKGERIAIQTETDLYVVFRASLVGYEEGTLSQNSKKATESGFMLTDGGFFNRDGLPKGIWVTGGIGVSASAYEKRNEVKADSLAQQLANAGITAKDLQKALNAMKKAQKA